MPPCCCLLLASVALVLFIAFGGRPLIVLLLGVALLLFIIFCRGRLAYYLSGPPCCSLLISAALPLRVMLQCRLVVVYCSPMPSCSCLLLFGAALLLFIDCRGDPDAVYYFSGPRGRTAAVYYLFWGRLVYYVSGPLCSWLCLARAALVLFITRQCSLVVVLFLPHAVPLLFITFGGRLDVV